MFEASASALANCWSVSFAEVVFPKSIGLSWTVVTFSFGVINCLRHCVMGLLPQLPSDWPVEARLFVCSVTGAGCAWGKLVAGFSVTRTVSAIGLVEATSSAWAIEPPHATTAVTIVPRATEQRVRFLLYEKRAFSFSWFTKSDDGIVFVIEKPSFLLMCNKLSFIHHKKGDYCIITESKKISTRNL